MSPETQDQTVAAAPLPVIDLDTMQPVPIATVKIGEQSYDVISLVDVPIGQSESVLGEEDHGEGGLMGRVALARKQIKLVVPALPDEVLATLTPRQIAELSNQVIGLYGPVVPGKE